MATSKEIDARIAYGATCTWWDSIHKVGHRGVLPCCPHCRGVLFEMQTEEDWWVGADEYEKDGHPGYRKIVEWSRGRCFINTKALEAAYKKENPNA